MGKNQPRTKEERKNRSYSTQNAILKSCQTSKMDFPRVITD